MAVNGNYGANPNYPSTYRNITYKPVKPSQEHEKWAGAAVAQQLPLSDEDFVQPGRLWEVLGRQPGQQDNFVGNVAGHLSAAKEPVRKRTYEMFKKINQDLGARIEKATEEKAPHPQSQAAGNAQARLTIDRNKEFSSFVDVRCKVSLIVVFDANSTHFSQQAIKSQRHVQICALFK
ncbi:MAG: hypothetical protein M1830_005157 [Pleopsidium flavum]|nr:MAG: hypothetical protein M1830_005157 [Pleopsidium flavum]